jgi:hypothetical protein
MAQLLGKLANPAVGRAIDIWALELSSGKFSPIKPGGDQIVRNVVATVRSPRADGHDVLGPGADEGKPINCMLMWHRRNK